MTDNTNDPVGVLRAELQMLTRSAKDVVLANSATEAKNAIRALNSRCELARAVLTDTTPAAIQHSEQRETVPAGQRAPTSLCGACGAMEGKRCRTRSDDRCDAGKHIASPVAAPVPQAAAQNGGLVRAALIDLLALERYIFAIPHSTFQSQQDVMVRFARGRAALAAPVPEAKAERPCQYPNCGCTSRASCNKNYRDTAPAVKHEAIIMPPLPNCPEPEHTWTAAERTAIEAYGHHSYTRGRLSAIDDYRPAAHPIAVQGSIRDDAEFQSLLADLRKPRDGGTWAVECALISLIDSRSPVVSSETPSTTVAAAPEDVRKAALEEAAKIVDRSNMRTVASVAREIRALCASAPSSDTKK